MKKQNVLISISIILFIIQLSCSKLPSADLVLKNGNIYTVNNNRSKAESLAIKNGIIIFLGDDDGVENYIDKTTVVIDLANKVVLPGFIDSHSHPISTVKQLYDVNLNGLISIEEIQTALGDFREKHSSAKFIRGRGWTNLSFLNSGPDKKYLDAIINDIPVSLQSEDGHSKWVNSKTLELAGITKDTKDPEGGVIERYPGTKEPSGTLREDASDLIKDIFPYYNLNELVKGLEAYQKMALSFGITTVHDVYLDFDVDEIAAYKLLETENRLNMRIRASLYIDPSIGVQQIEQIVLERDKHKGELVSNQFCKNIH